jgi:hypothetical protein
VRLQRTALAALGIERDGLDVEYVRGYRIEQ